MTNIELGSKTITKINLGENPAIKITNRGRDKYLRFLSEERRDAYIAQIVKHYEQDETRRALLKEEKAKMILNVKAGDFFYTSWGYEQTNIDFYQVTRVSGQRIYFKKVYNEEVRATGWACGDVVPMPDSFKGEEFFSYLGRGLSVKINDHYARPWDGKPKRYSSYA